MNMKMLVFTIVIMTANLNSMGQNVFYVSDAGNFQQGPYQIMRFTDNSDVGEVFIKDQLSWPQDILFLPNKNQVLVSNLSSNSIEAFDAKTGGHIRRFASGIEGPTRMRISKDGFIFVLQWFGDGSVKKFDLDGNFAGDATQTGVPRSIGFDWDKNGELYVSSFSGRYIEKFDKDGKSKGKFISSGLFGPTNIQFNGIGQLIVLDYSSGRVLIYDQNGTLVKTLITGLAQCEGIQINNDGCIIVGYVSGVKMYDKNGIFKKTLVEAGSNNLLNPNAVVFRESIILNINDSTERTFIDFLQFVKENNYIVSSKVDKVSVVNIFDYSGILVKTHDFTHHDMLDLSGLDSGLYLAYTILPNNIKLTQKVIILK